MFCISADDWSRPLVRVRTIVVQVQHPSLVSKLDSRLHSFLYCRLESIVLTVPNLDGFLEKETALYVDVI